MEASPAGSTIESLDQLERQEEIAQIERQESMFGDTFDTAAFDDAASFEATAATAATDVSEAVEESGESFDSLPEEAPDEAPHGGGAVVESPVAVSSAEDHADWQPEQESPVAPEEEAGPAKVMTVDDFAALEERVLKAVSLVRREREARMAAEERLLLLESQMLAQAPSVELLHQEIESLRAEREQVRQRVERLLSQLDALEL